MNHGYESDHRVEHSMKQFFGILIFLIFGVITITMVICGRDEPPPDDADLQFIRLELTEDENGVTHLNLATNVFFWPKDKENEICEMVQGTAWDANLVGEIIQNNTEALDQIEKALTLPHCQVPEITFLDFGLSLSFCRNMAKVMSLRAKWLFEKGDEKAAFNQAMQMIRFGHMMEDCGGGIIHYLVGMAIKGMGLEIIEKMIPDCSLASKDLKSYSDYLSKYTANRKGLANAFKVEYSVACKIIDDWAKGDFDLDGVKEKDSRSRWKRIPGYFFQPNKTKRICADANKSTIENISRNYSEMNLERTTKLEEPKAGWRLLTSPNAVGIFLSDLLLPPIDGILLRKCQEDLSVGATWLLLACKCYKENRGKLPDRLEDLVPEYIENVPQDPFDGETLRYSAAKKIIYSVGEDLKDSGGSEKSDSPENCPEFRRRMTAKDIVFKVAF